MKCKWIQMIGDYFYRYCQWILLGVFLASVITIFAIKLNLVVGTSNYAEIINDMLVNLSYSYIAAYLFLFDDQQVACGYEEEKNNAGDTE